jgi:hypothetical protein
MTGRDKKKGCIYPKRELSPEDYIVRLIGQFQVNDRLRSRLYPDFKSKPITYARIRRSEHLKEIELFEFERLLKKVVFEGRVYVTDGLYYLPPSVVSFQ